jgi:single-stranded-DNA-specific exonuclease
MLRPKTRWQVMETDAESCQRLMDELKIDPMVAKMLVRRGIAEPEKAVRFLYPKLEDLYDPFLLDGMHAAVNRIHAAIQRAEKILIYGDYDVDGVSSTGLMIHLFRMLQVKVDYYIPNRFREGYGIHADALQWARDGGFQLILSVDTGIRAVQEAAFAKELGLDLIITDHHEPSPVLPEAIAVLNPKKPSCSYPFSMLAGVGVAFKLATALLQRIPEELLEMVALGTIADLVPLVDENRIFVSYGLKRINLRQHVGMAALLEVAGIEKEVNAQHVAFALGPRINASGRLDSAKLAVEWIMASDRAQARVMAQELDKLNRERQQLVEVMVEEALIEVEQNVAQHAAVVVVAKEGWNIGVIGIVASRLVEKYHRPVVVLGIDPAKGVAKGSARSMAGYDMMKALTACEHLLSHYGGHSMAAGMTLPVENLLPFHQQLTQFAQTSLTTAEDIPLTVADEELMLDSLDIKWIDQLQALAPYGVGNPMPLFILHPATVTKVQCLGQQNNHLKLRVEDRGKGLDVIGFRFGEFAQEMSLSAQVKLLGELHMNEWNGRRTPQLILRDVSIPHLQIFDYRSNRMQAHGWDKMKQRTALFVCTFPASSKLARFPQLAEEQVLFWDDVENPGWTEEKAKGVQHLIFVEPPPSLEQFLQGLQLCTAVERLYFMYGDKELDGWLVKTPTRAEFKRLYSILVGKASFSLHQQMDSLMQRMGLSQRTLSLMMQVFAECGFLKQENGIVQIYANPVKQPLTESASYIRQLQREQVVEKLVYASYRELCDYISENVACKWQRGSDDSNVGICSV